MRRQLTEMQNWIFFFNLQKLQTGQHAFYFLKPLPLLLDLFDERLNRCEAFSYTTHGQCYAGCAVKKNNNNKKWNALVQHTIRKPNGFWLWYVKQKKLHVDFRIWTNDADYKILMKFIDFYLQAKRLQMQDLFKSEIPSDFRFCDMMTIHYNN